MEPISLETTDIFRGAFLLASGGDLAEIRVRNNGKRIATFLITGAGLDRLDRDYRWAVRWSTRCSSEKR